jgi:hypothetical protein
MNFSRCGSACWNGAARWARTSAAILALVAMAPAMRALQFSAGAGSRDVSLAEYRQHLNDLDGLVAACQAQRAKKQVALANSDVCNPRQIGPDDRVHWPDPSSETRDVRFDWLRAVFDNASKTGNAAQQNPLALVPSQKNNSPSVDELLAQARQRLQEDEKQATNPPEASPNYAAERKSLNSILAEKAYQGVSEVSPRERFLEWFDNLLDKFLSTLIRLGSHAPWIGWVLRVLLLVAICGALIWFLVRIERNARIRLIPDAEPAPDAPSAREWQLWLEDAQKMAAKRLWREAIHFLYWASIARLESMRLWPADRARTPREYLALMANADPRKTSLTELTRRFERTWYGGRSAADSEFDAALELARALGVASE